MAYEYTVQGKVIALEVDPTVVAVRFEDPTPNSMRAESTARAGVGPFATRFEVPGEKLTIVPVKREGLGPLSSDVAINSLNAQPEVRNALPVFRVGGNQVVASDRVIVGVKSDEATGLAQKYQLKTISPGPERSIFEIPPTADVFELCAKLASENGVRYAEPDFITIGRHIANRVHERSIIPTTAPLSDQYALRITDTYSAWEHQTGDSDIVIAILDEGVDTRHRDLASAIVGTYDGIDSDTYQEPNAWDGHGTACAGLAIARGASGTGVRGIGNGCSCAAVRIAFSAFDGGPWQTTNDVIARSIEWVWKSGAAVISNSWGGGAPSNAIAEEFVNARTRGRSGKGCVVVVAAGNANGPVTFPGNLDGILTISASNEYDEIKTPVSRDGETWWGTCFGPEVGIAAPGVHNLTADISGTGGYAVGDYTPDFNGTSSATPLVAGACGLVLSANPALSEAEVRHILTSTADKVGNIPYTNGRNDYFGFGRLNTNRAVQAAKQSVPTV